MSTPLTDAPRDAEGDRQQRREEQSALFGRCLHYKAQLGSEDEDDQPASHSDGDWTTDQSGFTAQQGDECAEDGEGDNGEPDGVDPLWQWDVGPPESADKRRPAAPQGSDCLRQRKAAITAGQSHKLICCRRIAVETPVAQP